MRNSLLFLIVLAWPAALFAAETQIIHPTDVDAPAITAGEGELPPDEEVPPEKPGKAAAAKAAPEIPAPDQPKTFNAVRLQGLNKVTARISTVDAPLGVVTRFENLEVIPSRCWQAPLEDRPENAALLEIRELKSGEEPQAIFKGWMFASSPALSALEHAVYDVTVIECENIDNTQ